MTNQVMTRRWLALPLLALSLAAFADGHGGHGGGGHGHGGYGHGGHGGHFRGSIGFYYNDPFWWGPRPYYDPFFYRPYVYEPPTVIVERSPPVYVQRQPAVPAPAPAAANSWYYCPNPAGYYPYVQNCSQPWVPVDPQSVSPPR